MIERQCEVDELRLKRYKKAAALLRRWSQEDPAYDEAVWDVLETELKQDRVRIEDRDETSP